ncbi:MAG: hypothetical protein DRI30_03500 [Chloroflexi bacterium]|nr:MAG: hypothetical protein DRI30_03500 [Chloroflexota bacterium]
MNPASLTLVAGLSALMLVVFLATGQQLNLTITAVVVTGGIATLAVFFYGREEAREALEDDDHTDEPPEATAETQSDEPPTPVEPDETQTIEGD